MVEPSVAASPGELQEERRLVTALFADVAGFGPLADRLDPEQLVEVIDPLLARLTEIVRGYGGRVEKFAGDAILALFGAPRSHGDDPARALAAALDIHGEVGRAPLEDGELQLHVGVNTGHGVGRVVGGMAGGDYAVLGDAVVLAQRLESVAPRGQTYVGETTYRLTADAFDFEDLGHLSLKGRRLPVRAWRLTGRRDPRAAAKGRAGRRRTRLVGREAELDMLIAHVDCAATARLAMSVLSGEPGLGKTRLTEAIRTHAEERGVRWLEARCVAYGASVPYGPYLDLVRELLGPDSASYRAVEDGDRPYVAHFLGSPSAETAGVQPDVFQRRLHRAVAALFADAARERLLAVAIEDLQWLDASSAALTADVVRLCADAPILVHLTLRPEARSLARALLAECGPDRGLLLDLGPLGPQSVASIVRSLAGRSLAAASEAAVIERSGGNPFFVEELLRWLLRPGERRDGEVDDLPPTIEGVLSARIDRLSRPAASSLLVGSVIGRQVPIAWLAAAATEVPDVERAIGELVDHGFFAPLESGEVVTFHHALVQEVAYNRLLRRQRRRLHERVALVGEELFGAGDETIAVLARHWYLAGDHERGPEYLLRAARVARGLFANEEAIVHLRRAAELATAGSVLAEVHLDLAGLLDLTGEHDEAQLLFEHVRDATGDPRAWRGLASTLRKRGHYADALDVLHTAEATVPPDVEGSAAIALELGRTLLGAGRPDEAVPALEAALDRLGAHGVDTGQALLYLARSELQCGRVDDALGHGERALGILEAHEDVSGLVLARRVLGGVYRHLGRLEEAAGTLRLGVALADRVGNVEELGACLINLGMVELRLGLLEDAIQSDRRAIAEFERVDLRPGRANGYANLAEKLYLAGRHEEAAAYCARALELAVELDDRLRIADVVRTDAAILLAMGEGARAAARAEEAADLFLQIDAGPDATEALRLAAKARDAAATSSPAPADRHQQ